MTYAPNDPDVNQMMAVFDKLSRQADTAKDEMAMAVNSFVGRAQDIIATKIAENAELRAQLAAVPVAQLRRQYSIESMTVHDFGLDAQDVDAWLRSLDGVGGHGNEAP